MVRESIGFPALRDMAAEAGLTHIEIELIERWWIPRGRLGHSYDVRDLLFEAADILCPAFIKIGSEQVRVPGTSSNWSPPCANSVSRQKRMAPGSRSNPCRSRSSTPFRSERGSPTQPRDPAVGLIIDAWHVFRAGTTIGDLARSLTPEIIFGVELDDAADEPVGTLFEDTVHHRLLCGDGSFDLVGLVELLRYFGFRGPWGVEILSSEFRQRPVAHALKLAAESAAAVLV